MDIWMASEEAYKRGYAKGYEACMARCEKLEKKVSQLEKSNRNWRRKVQRLRNGNDIVHCKDCKHRVKNGMCYMISGCPDLVGVGDDFFCAYGERK